MSQHLKTIFLRAWASVANPGLGVVVALLAVWETAASLSPNPVLPPLGSVLAAGKSAWTDGDLAQNYLSSLGRVALGFGAGAGLGLATGVLLGVVRWLDIVVGPLLTAIRQVPIFGLIPLFALWFGIGEPSKIALVAVAAFFPVALNTQEGLKSVSANLREVAVVLRFSRLQLIRRVLLPAALPAILTGLKHGLSFAWIAVIAAELFLSAGAGLGNIIEAGREQFHMDTILVGIVLIAGTGAMMNQGLMLLERRILRWRLAFTS